MFFYILLLLFLIPTFVIMVISIIGALRPETAEEKAKRERQERERQETLEKHEQQKAEYFNWLNKNYSCSKIFDFKNYDLQSWTWETYERCIVAIDEQKKVVLFGRREVPFKNIINCEILTETSYKTTTTTDDGISRAVVGGIIAGGAGAVVGASTANSNSTTSSYTKIKELKIYISDISAPVISFETGWWSFCHEKEVLQEIYSTTLVIIALNKNQ